jgi:hypothetical protein
MLNDERDAEAALKNLRDGTPPAASLLREQKTCLDLGGYVASASFKVKSHVADCPECSEEDDSTAS